MDSDESNKLVNNEKIIDHKIAVEDNERNFQHDYQWKSCCLQVDKRALSYFTQAAFSGVIVAFCVVMLTANQDCATFSRYSPLLTLVIGVWLPSPQFKNT